MTLWRVSKAKWAGVVAWGALMASGPAFAGQAEACYSAPVPSAQADKFTNATVLDCPSAGRHTLPQLAEAGWSVVTVQPVVVSYNYESGTGGPQSASSWMVVLQKGGK